MTKLLTASPSEAAMLLDVLRQSRSLGVATWATNKATPWILAGLNCFVSKMPTNRYRQYPPNTNLLEALHTHINRETGIRLSLFQAIKS